MQSKFPTLFTKKLVLEAYLYCQKRGYHEFRKHYANKLTDSDIDALCEAYKYPSNANESANLFWMNHKQKFSEFYSIKYSSSPNPVAPLYFTYYKTSSTERLQFTVKHNLNGDIAYCSSLSKMELESGSDRPFYTSDDMCLSDLTKEEFDAELDKLIAFLKRDAQPFSYSKK